MAQAQLRNVILSSQIYNLYKEAIEDGAARE